MGHRLMNVILWKRTSIRKEAPCLVIDCENPSGTTSSLSFSLPWKIANKEYPDIIFVWIL